VVEGDRLLALADQLLVEDVEHLQERHVLAHALEGVGLEAAAAPAVLLAPHVQGQLHHL
jgi:hypothetical protein